MGLSSIHKLKYQEIFRIVDTNEDDKITKKQLCEFLAKVMI